MSVFLQILLSVVILTLTTLVAIAGIQVFHILHQFRETLKKFNQILDHTHALSQASARPIAAVNEFFSGVKTLVTKTQDEIIESTPDRVITPTQPPAKPSFKRFFHRSGATLRPS